MIRTVGTQKLEQLQVNFDRYSFLEHLMANNTAAIQSLYVAYFNRPADAAGLAYWDSVVTAANGNTAAVSAAFAASAEYKAAYAGMDQYHVVAQVYQNLFGHAPDLAGLTFWGQALINGQMTVDNVVTQVAAGALGTDKDAYAAKVAAATSFTSALDTPEKVLAYSGDAANAVAKAYIAGVTDATSLTASIDAAALATVITNVIASAPGSIGQTFVLNAGMDQLVGTSGNDTFQAYTINPSTGVAADNFQSFDTINGGAGKDVLNLQIKGANNATYGSTSNIETINVTADVGTAIDASHFAGATLINQVGTAGAVTKLAATTTAGFQGSTINGALTVGASGASAAVSFNGVSDAATLAVSGSKLTSVTVSGTRVDAGTDGVDALALGVTTAKDAQTFSLNSSQKTTLTLTEGASSTKHITTVDASASTGSITFVGNTDNANIKTGAGNDHVTLHATTAAATSTAAAVNASVTTGAGNDVITITTSGDGVTTVDAGAGNDSIAITKIAGAGLNVVGGDGNDTVTLVTGSDSLDTTDIVDGGAGSNTITLDATGTAVADDYIVFNKLLKNFSTLAFNGAETLDASKLAANYTTISLDDASVVTGVGSQALDANGSLTATANGFTHSGTTGTYAGNLNITEATDASTLTVKSDVLTLAVNAVEGAATGTTLAAAGDIQSAVVTLTNNVDDASSPAASEVASVSITTGAAALAGLKSVTLIGDGSATIVNGGGKLVTVDASALGGTDVATDGATIGLTYSSTNAAAETIKLGSGMDTVTIGGSTYGAVDTISGLNLKLATGGTALSASSDHLHVTGVAITVVNMTTAQTDLDLALKDAVKTGPDVVFTMGGDTYVFHDAGTVGSIDAADTVVKLAGVTDVKAVVIALGGTWV
jgi:hypothetical protein